MRKYVLSVGQSTGYAHQNPERTASRSAGWDLEFQVWPNRASMARTIRMQEKAEHSKRHWRAVQPLSLGEGY